MIDVLFLDDDMSRTKKFISKVPFADTVETADECINQLDSKHWHIVFLDHDLGGEIFVDTSNHNTGTTVARWISENKPSVDMFVVHSFNHPAAKGMLSIISSVGYKCVCAPFGGDQFIQLIDVHCGEE